jgi:hypothetical protein
LFKWDASRAQLQLSVGLNPVGGKNLCTPGFEDNGNGEDGKTFEGLFPPSGRVRQRQTGGGKKREAQSQHVGKYTRKALAKTAW